MTTPSDLAGDEMRAPTAEEVKFYAWRGPGYWGPRDQVNTDMVMMAREVERLREAADTIDRLTSTGEADDEEEVERVARVIAEQGVGRPWDDIPEADVDDLCRIDLRDYARAAIAALASPREGHVEVPVEPAAQVPSIDDITVAAELQFPGKGYAHDRMAFRLGADWCAKQLAALPHNQGETKPEAWDLAARAENGETNL